MADSADLLNMTEKVSSSNQLTEQELTLPESTEHLERIPTLEAVRTFLKVSVPKEQTKKRRHKRMRPEILTDTPVKLRLEKEAQERLKKKALPKKGKGLKLQKRRKNILIQR